MILEKLSLSCDRLLSHRQLACCHSYSGIPLLGKDMLIYSNIDTERKPLLLTGHHNEISAMTFGKGSSPVLLCSASADYVIVWDIELCQRRTQEGKIAAGTVIGSLLGETAHLSFCFSDERVAACSGATVYILSSKRHEVISTLTSHCAPVTSAEFCPWNKDILVTTSEDRTFKVFDLKTEAVCYESFVLSAVPLLSVVLLEENRQLITGSADGQMWCFSLPDDHKCHLVTKMDLQKMKKLHQMHQGNVSHEEGVTEQSAEDNVETSKPVLKMASCSSYTDTRNEQNKDNSWFCIGSTDGLYVVDLATSELLTAIYFKDYTNLSITMAGSWSISPGWDHYMLLVSSLFTPRVVLLKFRLCDHQGIRACKEGFSVFPSSPPLPESPLNAELKKKEVNHPNKKGIKEQPLVFHSKVKSSGYTSAPRRTMFSPKTNAQKNPSSKKPHKISLLLRDYPADCAAPSIPHIHQSTGNKPVYCLQYSGDGKQILCGLGDSSVLLYKSSLAGSPTVYTGHDKPVSSVSWSLNRQCWLSASEDQSLRIWTNGSAEPAIIMGDGLFSKPIRSAQFYYLDKFVLLASGPSLYLYLYNVDIKRDDIKRYHQRSVVELARSITTTSATDITALAAINDFYSHIVLVCASDRSIQVFDMNKGRVASELPDAHSRAVHCITQNKGSMFSSQAPNSYNLFLTNAVTDGMKIWDLRTLRCVRRYENHLNRCHPCSSAFSPCGRFIATGSEDNCGYVYDIRSSSYLHKLQRHSDTVLSVTFNPATPELLTGTLDGNLRLFQSSSGASVSHDTSAAV